MEEVEGSNPSRSTTPLRHDTIRGVPPAVYAALRQQVQQRQQSLKRVVLDELTRAVIGRPVKGDFSDLAGKWTSDPAFDEILAAQRQIDPEKWRN